MKINNPMISLACKKNAKTCDNFNTCQRKHVIFWLRKSIKNVLSV